MVFYKKQNKTKKVLVQISYRFYVGIGVGGGTQGVRLSGHNSSL